MNCCNENSAKYVRCSHCKIFNNKLDLNPLYWIVSRIHEDMWIDSASYAITTVHNNAMNVHLNELVIKEDLPCFMKQFTLTMCQQRIFCAGGQLSNEILDVIWQLNHSKLISNL